MGWGCNRHEVDAGSDNWDAKMGSLLVPDGHSHEKPFNFGRDNQVCPFCWEELEEIFKAFREALFYVTDVAPDLGKAKAVARRALDRAEAVIKNPQDTNCAK